jgi:fatty-acyl-CoA synthase
VVGVQDDGGFDRLVAFVELSRSAAAADDLTAWCSERLSAHKVPNQVLVVDDLPRTRNGKVRKVELRSEAARLLRADGNRARGASPEDGAQR